MAQTKQNTFLPTSQRSSRRNRLLPFGIGGTLVLAGVLSLVSPFVGALVAATPLAYLTVDKVLRPSWKSFKQKTANVFRPGRFKLPSGHYGNLKVSDGGKTGNSIVDAMVEKLRSNGLQVSTDWDAAKGILKQLPDTIVRAKGIVPSAEGGWLFFDYVPGDTDIREGSPAYTGLITVIGEKVDVELLKKLFEVR